MNVNRLFVLSFPRNNNTEVDILFQIIMCQRLESMSLTF